MQLLECDLCKLWFNAREIMGHMLRDHTTQEVDDFLLAQREEERRTQVDVTDQWQDAFLADYLGVKPTDISTFEELISAGHVRVVSRKGNYHLIFAVTRGEFLGECKGAGEPMEMTPREWTHFIADSVRTMSTEKGNTHGTL